MRDKLYYAAWDQRNNRIIETCRIDKNMGDIVNGDNGSAFC